MQAVHSCRALKTVTIEEGLLSSLWQNFEYCTSLKSVNIPENIETLASFMNCHALEEINIAENNPYMCDIDGIVFSKDKKTLVRYPDAKKAEKYIVPSSVKKIANNAFYSVDSVDSIYVPKTVATVEEHAFVYSRFPVFTDAASAPSAWKSALAGRTVYYNYTLSAFKSADLNKLKEELNKQKLPKITSASQTTNAIKLSWSAVTRATGYTVYRYSPSKKAYVKAGTTTGKSYTVKNLYAATQYTFRVVAYFKASDGKVYNSDSYALIKTATKPAKATVTLKADAPGQLTFEWKAVSGANTYNVYYKVNGGSYKLYKTYTSAQKLTFKNLKGGDNYTIAVKAGIKVTGGTVWGDVSAKSAKVIYRTTRYLNTMKSGTYYMRYEISGVEFAEAMKGSLLYATGYDDYGDQYRMVYNGSTKKWYYIYDQYKLYTIIKDSDLPAEARGSEAIKSVKNQQVPTSFKSTKEQIYGETVFCESAKVAGLNTKYCYSGTKLAFVIIDLGNGIQVTQFIDEFTNKVPNSLFTIPSDYKYVA